MSSLRFYRKLIYSPWTLLFCIFLLNITNAHGEDIALDASWQASSNNPSDAESNNAFNQRYGLQWNPRVTRAISFNTSMNYSRNITTGNILRETLSPTGNLQIDNDIFLAEVTGFMNRTTSSQSFDQLDRSWEALLASTWEYPFWPSLSINLGQSWLNDTEEISTTDSSRKWSEFVAEWEMDHLETYYSYYSQQRDDAIEQSYGEETKHFGRIEYTRSLFENRLNFAFSGQLTNTSTDYTSNTDSGGNASIRVPLSQGVAGIDLSPETGKLPGSPGLIDGNTNTVVFTINRHEIANLGIKADLQAIDNLYVYTSPIDPLLISETASLRWDLYSSEDGLNWQKEVSNAPTSYDQNRFRYLVTVGGLKRIYLKLVVTAWPLSLSIPVTEIEAHSNQSDSGNNFTQTQEYTRTLTDLNVHYSPTASTRLSYSLVWDDSDYTTGNDRKRLFQTGNFSLMYNQYFKPTFTINDTSTTNSSISNNSQRSYALSIQSILLPTLETNVGITRNSNSSDDILENTSHTVYVNATAALYPNLDTTLDLNTSFNTNEVANSSTENMSLRWTLTARLRPTLLVDTIVEHGTSGVGFAEFLDTEASGGRATLNVNWRPSEMLSIMTNVSQGYGEQWANHQNFLLDTSLSVLRTSKAQFFIGHKISSTPDDTINSFNANWSWNISRFFSMQSIGNYLITQENNTWFINARLTARF